MKIINKIFLVFAVVAIMTSCTQRKYGHITGLQFNKKASTEKLTTRKGHYVSPEVAVTQDELSTVEEELSHISTTLNEGPVNDLTTIKSERADKISTSETIQEQLVLPKSLEVVTKTANKLKPKNIANKVKSKVAKKTKAGGLIYWILVLVLIILIVSLLESVLGTPLTRIIITVVLIAFLGHLLGLW